MKTQTPLTDMENRWVPSTKESFDALVTMGYRSESTYNKKMTKLEVYSADNGIRDPYSICQLLYHERTEVDSKQAYYHNGHFYDQPYEENKENKMSQIENEFLAEDCGEDESHVYNSFPVEEFTITEEKVPFPELEDIEYFTVVVEKWILELDGWGFSIPDKSLNRTYILDRYENKENVYNHVKVIYENSKDFKVTWKLKEKINRNLHENRPLALAIGYWLVNHDCIQVDQGDLYAVCGLGISKKPFKVGYGGYWADECTLPDDYIIPEQVLQWMKEYDHTS